MNTMKKVWARLAQRTDRVSSSIYAALLLFGCGVGLLLGNSVPDPFIVSTAIGSFALAVIMVGLAITWMLDEARRERNALLGVVYPEDLTQ